MGFPMGLYVNAYVAPKVKYNFPGSKFTVDLDNDDLSITFFDSDKNEIMTISEEELEELPDQPEAVKSE